MPTVAIGDTIVGVTHTPALISLIFFKDKHIYVTSVAQAFADHVKDSEIGMVKLCMPSKTQRWVKLKSQNGTDVDIGTIVELRFNFQEDMCLIQLHPYVTVDLVQIPHLSFTSMKFVKPCRSAQYDHFQVVVTIDGLLQTYSVTMFRPMFDTLGAYDHLAVTFPKQLEEYLLRENSIRVGLLLVRHNTDGSYSPAGQLRFQEKSSHNILWIFTPFYNSRGLFTPLGFIPKYQLLL